MAQKMLDRKDRKILESLLKDGRKSIVEISNELGFPRATVQERLKKMLRSGAIKKFVALPDYGKIGRQVTAFVFVNFTSGENVSQRRLAENISKIPGVYEVSVISGEWDILLKVRAGSVEEIGSLVVDQLRSTKGIEKTETSVVFQTISENV